jgi:hypothetical protein
MAARIPVRTLLAQLQMSGTEGRTAVKSQWVKWRADNHTPTLNAEVTEIHFPYVFMTWCLIKHSVNIAVFFYPVILCI